MSRPRGRLASSTSLTRCSSLSRLSSYSSSAAIAVRNEEEDTRRMYKCLIGAGLLLLASVTFLQLHLVSSAAIRQGSTNLDSLQNDNNHLGLFLSDRSAGDAAGGEGRELPVSDDEERGFLKLVWNGRRRTSQRNAAAAAAMMVGVESNTGTDEEEFETGEELVEEDEEEEEEEEPPADQERLLEAADMVSQAGHTGIGDMAAENVSSESVVISHDDDELLVQNKADNNASQFMQQQNEKFGETMRAMGTESRNGSMMKLGRTIALDGGEINIVDKQPDHGFKMDTGIMLGAGSKGMDVEKHEAAAAMVLNMGVVGRVSSSHHHQQLQQGFKEFIESWKERFDSDDDDFLDENVHWRQREDVVEIEDALLLSDDGAAVKSMVKLPLMTAGKVGKKKKGEEGSYNSIMNPVDVPMLQDPDTGSGPDNWMTKSDEAMLNALRVDGYGKKIDPLPSRFLLRGLHVDSVLHEEKEQEIDRKFDEDAAGTTTETVEKLEAGTMVVVKKDPAIELSTDVHQQENLPISDNTTKISSHGFQQAGTENQNFLHLSDFPGIRPSSLPFSVFMDEFLHQESCSIQVFMAWTMPPSQLSLTVHCQQTLESVFHFHPNACVIVFSDTIENDFFNTFLQKGFKVAVVQPNLHELLANTPADVFANVWVQWWHKIPLFHLHYTNLLCLVVLYKYGGVYMDMDVIVLKPLDSLCNTVGSEILANGEVCLNGAIMAFNKSSPFLRQCLEEFTATYNDTLLEWNGSELVTWVANFSTGNGGKRWMEVPDVPPNSTSICFLSTPIK